MASSLTATADVGHGSQGGLGYAVQRRGRAPPETETPASPTRRSGWWAYLAGVLLFLAYAGWMIGPYLRSVIVRDAAVTSWSNLATSPIDGTLAAEALAVGRAVGSDGIITPVLNDRLIRQALTEAEIRADLARARAAELEEFLNEIVVLDEERAALKGQYGVTFRAQLDAEIASLQRRIGVTSGRLELMRRIAARSEELARRGAGAEALADEARMRISDLELEIAELQASLDYARVRGEAAGSGVFITASGEDPEWVRGWRLELKLEKKQARVELRQAQAEMRLAAAALEAAEQDFRRLSEGAVTAPPGSVVWSELVAPGATVPAGSPVAEWLDCSVLMIDVPVSDAEVSLIRPGMAAHVVLEGADEALVASVLLTRGSAATLGRDDLVAVAKGRRDGVAQVLLTLPAEPEAFAECPVGRAAHVDFPDIGLIDVIRARLRL
jgi:multidrug resistance efflux pump